MSVPRARFEHMKAWTRDMAFPSRRFAHGDALVRQGELQSALFLVRVGAVRLAGILPAGREVVVAVLGPGDLFGETALLGEPSPVEARAIGRAEVEALPIASLDAVLSRHPGSASELLRSLASRLHRTSAALEEALALDVRTRVSSTLCELAGRHGVRDRLGVRVQLPITQEDLARMVGATRETVNRILGSLSSEGLIRSERRRFVIPDIGALAGAAERQPTP
jgi:CRP/FNR family cyclic AMP-dependent transcriptional regulator